MAHVVNIIVIGCRFRPDCVIVGVDLIDPNDDWDAVERRIDKRLETCEPCAFDDAELDYVAGVAEYRRDLSPTTVVTL